MCVMSMRWSRVRGTTFSLVVIAVIAMVDPVHASFQRVLSYSDTVPKLGRVSTPSLGGHDGNDGRACMSERGAIAIRSSAEGDVTGLVCVDGDGPRAIVRVGDPAPEGGVFAEFRECQFVGAQEVLFMASRRLTTTGSESELAVYRAGPDGLARVVGIADLGDFPPEQLSWSWLRFFANGTGALVLLMDDGISSHLFVVDRELPARSIDHDLVSIWGFGLLDSGDVVFIGADQDDNRGVLVARDGELRVLTRNGDVSPSGITYDTFLMRERRGDQLIVSAGQSTPFREQLLLYDPAQGELRPIEETDPAWAIRAAATHASAAFDAETDDDVSLLAYNRSGSVLIAVEDPGSGDLLLNQAPTGPDCPPNAWLSDTPPALPTLVPSPTPSLVPTRIPTPTRLGEGPITLDIQVDQAVSGAVTDLRVILDDHGHYVAGVQLTIQTEPPLTIIDCRGTPGIGKDETAFSLRGGSYLRALVLSLTNVDPIADGSELFSCRVQVAADARPGSYQFEISDVLGSTPDGDALEARSIGGTVTVVDPSSRSVEPDGSGVAAADGCTIDRRASDVGFGLLVFPALLLGWRRYQVLKRFEGRGLVGPLGLWLAGRFEPREPRRMARRIRFGQLTRKAQVA